MAAVETHVGVILQTHNIGEADRLCIVLTKDRGRIAAKARGVRKLKSRLGGTLLPFAIVEMDLHCKESFYTITDARLLEKSPCSSPDDFVRAGQGVELLLGLLHDDEPVENLFMWTQKFLQKPSTYLLLFTLCLLQESGLLPEHSASVFMRLTENQRHTIDAAVSGNWDNAPILSTQEKSDFSTLLTHLIGDHCSRGLKAGEVLKQMK